MSGHDALRSAISLPQAQRNRLVEEYLPLVRHVIGRLPITLPATLDKDDIFEVGVLGLINAATTFDPTKGAQFKTHAYVNVRGAILDELRRHDVVPRSRRDRIRQVQKTNTALEEELGRAPTPEELARALGLTVAQIDDVLVNMHALSNLSLDDGEEDSEGGFRSLTDCLASAAADPSDIAERNELKEKLTDAIMDLPEQERRVVVLYYAEGLLLKEIGEVLDVTESRVSQIHSRALWRLGNTLNPKTRAE
jgi:RNA polymerase sigma factor FliA